MEGPVSDFEEEEEWSSAARSNSMPTQRLPNWPAFRGGRGGRKKKEKVDIKSGYRSSDVRGILAQ